MIQIKLACFRSKKKVMIKRTRIHFESVHLSTANLSNNKVLPIYSQTRLQRTWL